MSLSDKTIRETGLLTETAAYDEPGSWGRMSESWPEILGDAANCAPTVPYGSYVLVNERGEYGAAESRLRVHEDHIARLREDFVAAGSPAAAESVRRRGSARCARKWW
jgi:hypothetical protein